MMMKKCITFFGIYVVCVTLAMPCAQAADITYLEDDFAVTDYFRGNGKKSATDNKHRYRLRKARDHYHGELGPNERVRKYFNDVHEQAEKEVTAYEFVRDQQERCKGNGALAFAIDDYALTLQGVQADLSRRLAGGLVRSEWKLFSKFHVTGLYTNASSEHDLQLLQTATEDGIDNFLYRYPVGVDNPLHMRIAGGVQLFGSQASGKKFLAVPVEIEGRLQRLLDMIGVQLPADMRLRQRGYHVSLGEVNVASHEDDQFLQTMLQRGDVVCPEMPYVVTTISMLRSWHGRPIRFGLGPSYHEIEAYHQTMEADDEQ